MQNDLKPLYLPTDRKDVLEMAKLSKECQC